jgi:hypothetical protein
MDELVDVPDIDPFLSTEVEVLGIIHGEFDNRIGGMGGGAVEIELGRATLLGAGEGHLLRPHPDVETLPIVQGVFLAVHPDAPRRPDVDDPHLPSLEKIIHAQFLGHGQFQSLIDRADTPGNDPIDMAVDHLQGVLLEEPLNEKLPPQLLRIQGLGVFGVNAMPDIHL